MSREELRELRNRLGFTQEQLARELEVAEDTVRRWEKGRLPISRRTELAIRQIAARLE